MGKSDRITLTDKGFALVRYDEAKRALAAAHRVDEAKSIRDKAVAIQLYAKQAKDTELIGYAAEIKLRAERRAGELLHKFGERRGGNQTARDGSLPSNKKLGLSDKQSSAWQKLAAIPEVDFEQKVARAKRKAEQSTMTIHKDIAADETKRRREASRNAAPLPDGMDFREGDCREVLANILDATCSLILTDPPFSDEALPLIHWLAGFALRVLIPGGSVICYCGNFQELKWGRILEDVGLRHWSNLALVHNERQAIRGKYVYVNHKPVLWFVKQFRRGTTMVPTVLQPLSGRDKSEHPWAQGEAGVTHLIHALTEAREVVVDPFSGTNLWGEIAARNGRRWIGADIVRGGSTKVAA